MELQTISQVSKHFNISTRTLRYYEKLGLIHSIKKEGYAYRQYNQETILTLQQILILRKLRVSLKDIQILLNHPKNRQALTIFQHNIDEINQELEAYSLIKSVLEQFVKKINQSTTITIKESLLNDDVIIQTIENLTLSKIHFKEENTMQKINQADKKLSKAIDIRIISLPPMSVVSSHYIGENCEDQANATITEFIQKENLLEIKPDLRHFGFNNPYFQPETKHGYEVWVSIPEDLEIPTPLIKKTFRGGLYAAHAIRFGEFDHWQLLSDWLQENDTYELDFEDLRCEPSNYDMDRCLEEHLNFTHHLKNPDFSIEELQLDLLIPIKEKKK